MFVLGLYPALGVCSLQTQELHNMTQSVSGHHQTYLGWAKGLSGKKEAGSTKVLLGITSMCTYHVKMKECQITWIELSMLGFIEACYSL